MTGLGAAPLYTLVCCALTLLLLFWSIDGRAALTEAPKNTSPPPSPPSPLPQHTAQNVVQEVYLPTTFPLFPLDVDAGAVPVQEVPGHCTTVAALLKEYTVQSCYDPVQCAGEVRVVSRGCALQEGISAHPAWEKYLRAVVGPDLFRLLLTGPELLVALQEFNATSCGYRLRFGFTRRGEYTAKFRLQLDNFWGVNERIHNTRHWRNKDVAWLPTYSCTTSPQGTKARHLGRWVRHNRHLDTKLRGAEWEWQWYNGVTPRGGDLGSCLKRGINGSGKGVTVRVVGDSQARSVYHAVKHRLEGGKEAGYAALRAKVVSAATAAGGVALSYTLDSYLQNVTAYEEDVLVIGFGAHPASWGQWSYDRMHRHMLGVAEVLCRRKGETVWFGSPAWPKGKPASVDNFRVTNARLGIFNRIARDALSMCTRIRHLDFFQISLGQLKLSKDGAHYDKSVVMPTFVDLLHEALCS